MQRLDKECLTVQEKLVLAFPGNYGLYLSLHFGRFLREPIKTEEQRAAYDKIVDYLDNAAALIPDELNDYMEQAIQLNENVDMEKYEDAMNLVMQEAIRDSNSFFRNIEMEKYIAYRTSEEFKQSPHGKTADLMTEFQKNSGYHDIFIANLMIVSPAYKEYCEMLEAANTAFLKKYPQAVAIYGAESLMMDFIFEFTLCRRDGERRRRTCPCASPKQKTFKSLFLFGFCFHTRKDRPRPVFSFYLQLCCFPDFISRALLKPSVNIRTF